MLYEVRTVGRHGICGPRSATSPLRRTGVLRFPLTRYLAIPAAPPLSELCREGATYTAGESREQWARFFS
jgi:hypothetical protein